jgi:hypothetical protein
VVYDAKNEHAMDFWHVDAEGCAENLLRLCSSTWLNSEQAETDNEKLARVSVLTRTNPGCLWALVSVFRPALRQLRNVRCN